MRKKIITFFLVIIACIGITHAEIYSGTCGAEGDGANLQWKLDTETGVLDISGYGAMQNFEWSYRLVGNNYECSSSAPWNSYRSYITVINFPEGLTTIGDAAFPACISLETLNFPEGLLYIGTEAFHRCNKISSLNFPVSLDTIGAFSFNECENLKSVIWNARNCKYKSVSYTYGYCDQTPFAKTGITSFVFGEEVEHVYSNICDACTLLTSVVWNAINCDISETTFPSTITSFILGERVERIPTYLCKGMNKLTFIEIPNSVTSIGDGAFYGCIGLSSVTIPNNVTSIGDSAFYGCIGLTSVTIGKSVASIGNGAFYNCSGLTSVTIPNNVTSIGNHAFYNCSGLTSVTIGESVTSIGDSAFYGCIGLTSITLSCGIKSIGSKAFPNNTTIVKDCGVKKSETNLKLCEGEKLAWNNINLSNVKPTNSGNYEYKTKTVLYDDSIATLHLIVTPVYSIKLNDTTLCYDEDLYIGGVKCNLTKQANTKQTWTRNPQTVDGCDSTITINVTWKKLPDFSVTAKDVFDTPNSGSITYKIEQSANYNGDYYYTLNGVKNASCSNLSAGNYRLVFYSEECGDSIVKNITINQYGIKVNGMYYLLDENNLTATLTYRGTSSSEYEEYAGDIVVPENIEIDGKVYQVTTIGSEAFYGCEHITSITLLGKFKISYVELHNYTNFYEYAYGGIVYGYLNTSWGWVRGKYQTVPIYVPFGTLSYYKENHPTGNGYDELRFHVLNPNHINIQSRATSATIVMGNTEEQKHISSSGINGSEKEFAGNVIEYIGLEPKSTYSDVPFFIITEEGDYDTIHYSFNTPALELTTKPSKAVSSTTAILLAETNMSDAEVSCGFEYKRNDAPADMEGNKVYCPVASGTMAGRLKNLKDDVYYKYRAFYQSATGKMYYGDWQYIFTGDIAVEFDPVLYTYNATVVKETEATISGYALAGAADFTEQGFEYWAERRVEVPSDKVQSTKDGMRRMTKALGEHIFVPASGINMRVTLTDLDAGTVYKYRAYGKVGDQVYYGAEQSFTTRGTYTPPTYMITFVNWDDTELQKSPVAENTMPVYTGETPVRPSDEEFTYTFKGWTPELVVVTGEATYKAEFTAEKATAIENITQEPTANTQKILLNGQLFILRGDKVYTLQGQEVK